LIFRDGIDWKSFATSFQELQQEQKLKIEGGNKQLSIRAIETRDDGSFVIRINTPSQVNKAEIEKSFKQKYKKKLKAKDNEYRRELKAKQEQIKEYRKDNADFKEIIKSLAERQISISQNLTQEQGDNNAMTKISQSHSGSGDNVAGDKNTTNNYNSLNLAQAAADIEQLLQQLTETYPTTTTKEKMVVATEAIDHIETNPDWKKRIVNAAKKGGLAAIEKAIGKATDSVVASTIAGVIKGWLEETE